MTPPIDPQAIAALRELAAGDPNFMRDLIDVFLTDTPERFADLDRAIEARDAKLLTRAAHSMKGSAGNFGATALAELAWALERAGQTAAFPDAAAQLPAARQEYARVAAALQPHR